MDRFDLEQQIMRCWQVTDDLDTVIENILEGQPSTDETANMLIGVKGLVQVRFEKLLRSFEQMIAEGKFQDEFSTTEFRQEYTIDDTFKREYDDVL